MANLMSDSNGKFEFEVPIYEFELIILYYFSLTKWRYDGLLYFPYFVIEGTDDAYVSTDYSFRVKKSDINKTLKLGSI